MSTKNDVIRPAALPSQSLWTRHWQKLVAVAVWAAIVGALFWYIRANDLSPAEAVLRALGWMQSSPWAPALYIALYALRPLTLFSATVLTISGGFLFGPVWGVALTVVAANVSATVAFFVGRYFGAGFLEGNDSAGLVQRYANRLREDSFLTVLIMRFIFLPYDLVSYLSGFLHIHFWPFLLATALGSIPGTIAFVLLGASASPQEITNFFLTGDLPSLDWRVLALSVAMFVASIVLARVFKRRERRIAGLAAPGTTDEAS